jgi:hypothetical protein
MNRHCVVWDSEVNLVVLKYKKNSCGFYNLHYVPSCVVVKKGKKMIMTIFVIVHKEIVKVHNVNCKSHNCFFYNCLLNTEDSNWLLNTEDINCLLNTEDINCLLHIEDSNFY